MIKRNLEPILLHLATKFPVIALLGPRQSGKTTLAQLAFPSHKYVSLEDFDIRATANSDPRAFLDLYKNDFGIILDEIQHAPQLHVTFY
jgi:predicted AAA+ superfamily ATPase